MALLQVNGISKRFGGVRALDRVDLAVAPGEIHGLIGPNGSGKTTLINVVTGVYMPDGGDIWLDGQRLDGLSPHRIARLGVSRTFQNIRLFHSLTVLENVLAAQIAAARTGFFSAVVNAPANRQETGAQRARARELLALVGLADESGAVAGGLPYGKQKLLELARALGSSPRLLLLDEPAAGLNESYLEELLKRLEEIRTSGVTLLIIEHHMQVIMNICHRITVLNFGQRIAVGTPREIQNDPAVIDAYLGREEED